MLSWYAIYVNVKHEKKVVQKLHDLDIEAYSPVVKKLQQWSDRKKWVEFPMLSGYVFVKIDLKDKEKVLNCPGVFAFIKFNGEEARIRESEISVLKSIESSGYDVTQEVAEAKLNDRVEIVQGPLKGLTGTIVQIQNTDYLQIALESLNQTIRVKVPKHIIKIIDPIKRN
jgi:transcription antitermination factor NusG